VHGMKKISISLLTLTILVTTYFVYNYLTSPYPVSPYLLYAQAIPNTYRIGFTNLDKETSIPTLTVKGSIPSWLSGTLLRNGPAKFTQGKNFVSNWFDGLAMLHAFSFNKGTVSYTNKFLKTSDYQHVLKTGNMSYTGFAQDPSQLTFKRLLSYFIPQSQEYIPNANVSIAQFTDHFVALTETPLPIEFDPRTLDTLGVLHYNDTLPQSSIHESAHPHYDPERKEHLSYLIKFGRMSTYVIYTIKDGSTQRIPLASIDVAQPSYMHSFAITEHYAILTAFPFVVNPLDLLLSRKAFIKNFSWKPQLGTQFIVIDRINKKILGTYKAEPFFAFHHINAFEHDNVIVLDIITYPDASGIGKADFNTILGNKITKDTSFEPDSSTLQTGQPTRYALSLNTKKITSKKICERFVEFPRINYERYNGKDYTYMYGESNKAQSNFYVADSLVKINVKTGDIKEWYQDQCYPGEPIFVAAPNAKTEDDGVILSVILDAQKEISFLLILNAQTFTEIARAHVPHHIPFGIHGLYVTKI
jgi:beta,beta-carotene 9',10'-dioxygenase